MEYTTITLEVRENTGYLTLNRPDAANSMNKEMARELMDAAIELSQSPEIRALLISGAGKIFCAGGDVKEFNSLGKELPRHIQEMTTYLHAAVSRLVRLEVPVVAAVHPLQIVDATALPLQPHDWPLDWIITPDEAFETRTDYSRPNGLDWNQIRAEQYETIPVLSVLKGRLQGDVS